MTDVTKWHLLVPVRGGSTSKSRLVRTGLMPKTRAQLAQAFASDVVTAALNTRNVEALTVITRDTDTAQHFTHLGASIFSEAAGIGLSGAVSTASDHIRRLHPGRGIAALMGDIPGLTSEALSRALSQAAKLERGVVADLRGTGTVLLTATGSHSLSPSYGDESYDRHVEEGYIPIIVPPDSPLRRDVDTFEDLNAAIELNLGAYTKNLLIEIEM